MRGIRAFPAAAATLGVIVVAALARMAEAQPTVPSYAELRERAAAAVTSGMISFTRPVLGIDGGTLYYNLGAWRVAGTLPEYIPDALGTILLHQAGLEALRRWSVTPPQQQGYVDAWSGAIAAAEREISSDLATMRAGRSPATSTLGGRVRTALESSLGDYARTQGFAFAKEPDIAFYEQIPEMTIRVIDDPPNTRIFMRLAWDYELDSMKGLDPLDRMELVPVGVHRRPVGLYVYLLEQNNRRSSTARVSLQAGLNDLAPLGLVPAGPQPIAPRIL